uniref:Uncharacterized protein n=1 Tax=Siphoviridae sp. ct8NQ14 TaxID=2825363 RepID=A0A8S5PM27_9CAUD|nr:MAG TPA: hypothetical protein [Siphoviridae sp. ct8NQ14]
MDHIQPAVSLRDPSTELAAGKDLYLFPCR